MKKIAVLFITLGFLCFCTAPTYAKCSHAGSVIGGVVAGMAIGAVAANAFTRPYGSPHMLHGRRMYKPLYRRHCHCMGPVHMTSCCNYAYPAYVNYSYRIR